MQWTILLVNSTLLHDMSRIMCWERHLLYILRRVKYTYNATNIYILFFQINMLNIILVCFIISYLPWWMKLFIMHMQRQNTATGERRQKANSASSPPSSLRGCPVLAAYYENGTTPWSADRYVRLCSIVTTSRAGGAQRKRLVYTSTSNQLYVHVVNVTAGHVANDHVLLRYDGRSVYCNL